MYGYPLYRFLGIPNGENICCIFHDDTNPSATVFQSGTSGKWLYHCHSASCENLPTLTIKTLVERIGSFTSEVDSLDFLKEALNVSITDNEWSRKQHATIDLIMEKIVGTDEQSFSALCPTSNGNIRYGKHLFIEVLIIAKASIQPTKYARNGDVYFYLSMQKLMKTIKAGKEDRKRQWLKCFCYHKLLEAVPDSEAPKDLLAKVKRNSENKYKHASLFKVSSTTVDHLKDIVEPQGMKWKQHHYTIPAVKYELFMRTEGAEVADRLYPQHYGGKVGNIKTTGIVANARAEARHERIHEIAADLLREQGYFTKNQLVERYGSKEWGEIQSAVSLPDICNAYGLIRRKAGKALKQRFSIESKGFPYIYFVSEDR